MRLESEDVAAGFRHAADLLKSRGVDDADIKVLHNIAETLGRLPGADEPRGAQLQFLLSLLAEKAGNGWIDGRDDDWADGLASLLESQDMPPPGLRNLVPPGFLSLLANRNAISDHAGASETATAVAHYPLAEMLPLASAVADVLREENDVDDVLLAGDCRRARASVSELQLLLVSDVPAAVARMLESHAMFRRCVITDNATLHATLRSGDIPVVLRCVHPEQRGVALFQLTGSVAHLRAVERLGVARNLRITPAGLIRSDREESKVADNDTENSVYAALGLPWIEPELREDRGEIEAAREGRLPQLVTVADIRGDLHCAPGNRDRLLKMLDGAKRQGLEYLAVTAPTAFEDDIHQWLDTLEALDCGTNPVPIKALVCPIREDGSLATAADVLARADLVIGQVQSHFDLAQGQQTERIIRAMDHPAFNVLATPAARADGQNRRYAIDLERVMRAACERHCMLEIDPAPLHPELPDMHWRIAGELGVKVALGSRARSPAELNRLQSSLGQARRSWLQKKDIINTRTLAELRKQLRRV